MEEHQAEILAEQPWEDTLELLTADMNPERIDISVLARRYRDYIQSMQEFDLSVPARAVRILAALLKIKTMALNYEEEEQRAENPMDFDGDLEDGFFDAELEEGPGLRQGPALEMPVKPRPKRRMKLDELKKALNDAMEVKQRREQRQEAREELNQEFEFEEDTINEKINSLFSRLKGFVSKGDQVEFSRLLDEQTNEDRIEKFLHVLHLENDKKVRCIQEEFLGDLYVKPEEEQVTN